MSFLSVVVATYKRVDTLKVTLDRLANQTLSKDLYEVIVVDDGSPDNTEEMVTALIPTYPVSLRYLRHENRGPGYSENRGIRESKGPWILLIADDIHPFPDMLKVHYDQHVAEPAENVAVGGKVIQSPDLPKTVFLNHWDPFRYYKFEDFKELSYLNFWACNVSFKKDFVVKHGMFIERRAAAHEDTELGWRLFRNGGMKLLYRKDALAHHYHLETIESAVHRAYERGIHFDVLADTVDDPGLYVRVHLVTWKTLPHFFKSSDQYIGQIVQEDKGRWKFLVREAARRVIFNRVTVPFIMMPVIRNSEHNRFLAMFVSGPLLRGTVAYHFLRGLAELRRRRQVPDATPLPV